MSTLKTHNLQSPDAGSVNIVMAPNAGMVVAGISTFNNKVLIGTNTVGDSTADDLTIATSGSTGITLRSDSGYAGNIQFSDGTSGDDQQRGIIQYHHSDDSMRFFTDAVRRFTITSAGLVGIGTDNPAKKLEVFDNTHAVARIRGGAGGSNSSRKAELSLFASGAREYVIRADAADAAFKIYDASDGNADRLYINSSGSLGVNLSTPKTTKGIHISKGAGASGIGNSYSLANEYLHFGYSEHNSTSGGSGLFTMGFGYVAGGTPATNSPAYLGYKENSTGGYTKGDLVFATRDVTTDSAPTERLRITSGGKFGFGTDSPDQMVHIHKGSAGSVSSTANTVLTLENSTTNILQFLNPNNTAAQVRFGDPQDDGVGFIEYSHNANTMSFGVYGPTRMQLDSNGHLGIAVASVTQLANSKQLTLRPTDDDGIRFVRPGDGNNNPNVHLDLTTTTSGSAYPSGEAYTVKYRTYNCDQIFETYEGGGTGGHIAFKTAPQGGTPTERLLINEDGQVTKPNQIAFHVYDSISSNAFSSNVYADFNSVHFNRGNCYSTSNGRFTCTVAGTYGFWCNMLSNGSSRLFHEVRKNGSRIEGTRTESGTTAGLYQSNTTQAIVDLAVGDWIAIHVGSGGAYGGAFSSFCGYLLG